MRDLDLIRELEAEHESRQWVITIDKEAIKEIEQELERQQKEKHDNVCWTFRTTPVWEHVLRLGKLLTSLTDTLPS